MSPCANTREALDLQTSRGCNKGENFASHDELFDRHETGLQTSDCNISHTVVQLFLHRLCFRHRQVLKQTCLRFFGQFPDNHGIERCCRSRTPLAKACSNLPAFSSVFRHFPAHDFRPSRSPFFRLFPAFSGVFRRFPAFSGVFRRRLSGVFRRFDFYVFGILPFPFPIVTTLG